MKRWNVWWLAVVGLGSLWSKPASATDSWSSVRTGIDLLHRQTSGPQDIWAARIDLSRPEVALHASADRRGVERGVSTLTFARNVGAVVAINTDWSDGVTPVGLAISDGWLWNPHIPNNTVGGTWGVVGCTVSKECTLMVEEPLDRAWWFSNPLISPYRYFHATGANGIPMVQGGVAASGCYDSARNPRSAICVEADGVHMWMVAVDGRRSSAIGMTCDEVRTLLLDLGCYDGLMLDGGGSTTLVVEGAVVNTPSDGSPRVVSNHLGVLVQTTTDASCTVANGRFCATASEMVTCQGGVETARGDCATYGATCEEDGDFAYCVDWRCPAGEGQGAACLSETVVAGCTDGAYGEGDCGYFGLVCGGDSPDAQCMDPACEAGPSGQFCGSSGELASCSEGVFSSTVCSEGSTCTTMSDTAALCVDDRCPAADGSVCDGDTWIACTDGVVTAVECTGRTVCNDSEGCVEMPDDSEPSGDDGGGGSEEDSTTSPEDPEPLGTREPEDKAGGCAVAPAPSMLGLLLGLVALGGRRRRA